MKSTPKLLPDFALLLAGTNVKKTISSEYEEILINFVLFTKDKLLDKASKNSLIYGNNASENGNVRILTDGSSNNERCFSLIAEKTQLSHQTIECRLNYCHQTDLVVNTNSILLNYNNQNDNYLSESQIIQEDTLRILTDILIWIGDFNGNPKPHEFRLLKDTLLEGKPIIWFHEDNIEKIG